MNKEMILSDKIKPIFSSKGPCSHWFGYYNYSPISADGTKLLSHKVDFDGRSIKPDDTAEIGFFTLSDGEWHRLSVTHAINWQQGAMLQWLGPDFNTRVIFNDVEGERFVSRIYDVNTGALVKTIPFAIYGVTPDGKRSITLQFERCYWCRAYHYESIQDSAWDGAIHPQDGVFSVDLETGNVERIISIDDVLEIERRTPIEGEKHWLEHIMLNPSGTRFAFYHRFGTLQNFKTVGFTANIDGSGCKVMPIEDASIPSHLGWKDDDSFSVFCYSRSKAVKTYQAAAAKKNKSIMDAIIVFVRRTIKKIVPQRVIDTALRNTYYAFVSLNEGASVKMDPARMYKDGHPSFIRSGQYMLTDTYADKRLYRHLFLYEVATGKIIELGRFYSPFNNCGYRSDLHPRCSKSGEMIVIDSAHSGQHQIYVFRLEI